MWRRGGGFGRSCEIRPLMLKIAIMISGAIGEHSRLFHQKRLIHRHSRKGSWREENMASGILRQIGTWFMQVILEEDSISSSG